MSSSLPVLMSAAVLHIYRGENIHSSLFLTLSITPVAKYGVFLLVGKKSSFVNCSSSF